MLLKFPATLNVLDYKDHNITKSDDLLCVRYDSAYRDKIRAELRKINEKNAKNLSDGKEPVELDITVDIHYKKRSLDANRWMWAIHDLEARIINGKGMAGQNANGTKWVESGAVTPEMIHDDYLQQYAKKYFIYAQAGMVNAMREVIAENMGRILEEKWLEDRQEMMFTVWKTSRFMTASEFYEFSEHIKAQLLSYGIDIDHASDFSSLMDERETLYRQMSKAESDTTKQENKSIDSRLQAQNVGTSSQSADNSEQVALTNPVDSVSLVTEVFHGKVVDKQLDIF